MLFLDYYPQEWKTLYKILSEKYVDRYNNGHLSRSHMARFLVKAHQLKVIHKKEWTEILHQLSRSRYGDYGASALDDTLIVELIRGLITI